MITAISTIDSTVVLDQLKALWGQAVSIWVSGGPAMIAIAVIALVMFSLGMHVYLRLREKGFQSLPEETWRHWINNPDEGRGPIGELIDAVMSAKTLKDAEVIFEEVRTSEVSPFDRDLGVMKICVSAAPLLGLLGTVNGMLATFAALASGAGGEKTMDLVAEGISEALVTTETGLVIALPGLFLQHQLAKRHDRYKAFLAHLETVCTQTIYNRLRRKKAAS